MIVYSAIKIVHARESSKRWCTLAVQIGDTLLTLTILLLVLYFTIPLVLQRASGRFRWISGVGVITWCYIAGILIGNLPCIAIEEGFAKPFMGIVVAIAIPLLLFNSDFGVWRKMGARMLLAFFLCIVSVAIAVTAGTVLFRSAIDEAWIMGSMLMGVYTGGSANLNAIGLTLNARPEVFPVLNGVEMLFGGAWLLFLLTAAKPLAVKIFKRKANNYNHIEYTLDESVSLRTVPQALGIALLAAAIAFGIALLCFKKETAQMTAVFLLVTTLGIAGSGIGMVRRIKGTYGLGNYFLMVFGVAVGSLADVGKIIGAAPSIIVFVLFVMCASILIHLLLCLLFGIDADAFLMASSAGIYGPPFVPLIARAIGNPYLIPVGLALGVLGLAIGNYCGYAISHLLERF